MLPPFDLDYLGTVQHTREGNFPVLVSLPSHSYELITTSRHLSLLKWQNARNRRADILAKGV